MRKIFIAICMAVTFFFGVQVPAEAALIGKNQEISMGQEVAAQLENQYGVVQDAALQARVNAIGQRLVAVSDRQDLEYTFKVLNSDEVNALAVPGGFIYVFKGLIDFMPSDDELAGVLGHEIGHVVKRHSVKQIEKQMALTLLTIILTKGQGFILADAAMQALMAGYSRSDERQADEQGFMLTNKAGYNPYSMLITVNKLQDLSELKGNPGYGLFSSHPEPEKRVERVNKALAKMKITPTVTINDGGIATVNEGNWNFNITKTHGTDKPEYRAKLMAGALYLIKKGEQIDETRFITVDNYNYSDIYYDDIHVLRVYEEDAYGFGSISDYAGAVALMLQDWTRAVKY
ncbi:MAG TPA: M48 family metalloprotease [Candidatus Avacidaminococcus intestinavium]|uniref:M48 family metalloprotease n=1 Tax=Candidatus Avacidaminococcus intestinavium TaxID=2840684 RepID=A0A9D1SLM3_9FIRM|nr:M48 family metalloprotease [Candidatus Avacidaminococcus intestinavium]